MLKTRQAVSTEEDSERMEREMHVEKERQLQRLRNKIAELKASTDKARTQIIDDLGTLMQQIKNAEDEKTSLNAQRAKLEAHLEHLEKKRDRISVLSESVQRFGGQLIQVLDSFNELM